MSALCTHIEQDTYPDRSLFETLDFPVCPLCDALGAHKVDCVDPSGPRDKPGLDVVVFEVQVSLEQELEEKDLRDEVCHQSVVLGCGQERGGCST